MAALAVFFQYRRAGRDDAVKSAHFVDDAVGDFDEQRMQQFGPVRSHEIGGLFGSQRHYVFVGTTVARDPTLFTDGKNAKAWAVRSYQLSTSERFICDACPASFWH